MDNESNLMIEPHNPKGGEIIGKIVIGLIVGLMISFLVLIIIILVQGSFRSAFNTSGIGGAETINPLIPLILIIIGFLSTLIGNMITAGLYSLLFSGKYYDFKLMFNFTIIVNIIIFFIFAPLYLVYFDDINTLYLILAFHILFSVFITGALIDSMTNPNYSGVYIIGTGIGLTLSVLIFGIIIKMLANEPGSTKMYAIIVPPILAYTLIPFMNNLWEKIYYKFYEMDNNFLYIPTINEIMVDEEEMDEINVDF